MVVLYLEIVKFSKTSDTKICEVTGSGEAIMDISAFYSLILPLGIMVIGLVGAVYYYARREDVAKKKTKRLMQAYIKEKAKQKQSMNKELSKIDKLLEEKSIDEETCERLKNVLIVMNTKENDDQTTELLQYVKNGK